MFETTLNPSVINGHATGLKKNAIYPLHFAKATTFTIPKGQQSFNKNRLFPDECPKMLMLAMVDNDAFNGNLSKNPLHFQDFGLIFLALYRDGMNECAGPSLYT